MEIKRECKVVSADGAKPETVDHPAHYGGAASPFEAIKVIYDWGLGFCLGNTLKYLARAGKKDDRIQDLKKALWYLDYAIGNMDTTRFGNGADPVTQAIHAAEAWGLDRNLAFVVIAIAQAVSPGTVYDLARKRLTEARDRLDAVIKEG